MLCEWAGAFIDGYTGEFLEYCQLRKTQGTKMHGEYCLEMKLTTMTNE